MNKRIEIGEYVFVHVLMEDMNDFNSKCISMITLSYLCDTELLLTNNEIENIIGMIYDEFEYNLKQNDNDKIDNKSTKKLFKIV